MKFKLSIALPTKFGSKGFITVVKVIKIWRSYGEPYKLRYVYPIWGTPGDIALKALLQLANFTLGPDATLNIETHKNSVCIKAPNSVNASMRKHKNQINHYNKQRLLMANSTVCQSKWKPIAEPRRAKKGKRKVQGVPQSQTAAIPRPQEEEERHIVKDISKPKTYRPSQRHIVKPQPLVKVLRRGRHWVWGPNRCRAIKEWSIAINDWVGN